MSKQNGAVSIREIFEKVVTAVASTAIIAFMAAGAFAMCAPNVLVA